LADDEKKLKYVNILQPVIIKGFRGEPEVLNSIGIDNFFVTVVGKGGKTQMKLKVKYAYRYDEDTYKRLRKAFDSNDSEVLEQEWQKAKNIVLS
jgi:hypothetical protein